MRNRLLDGVAIGGLHTPCSQGLDETVDATTLLYDRGKCRALGYAHACPFDDDVDNGKVSAFGAQSPIDRNIVGGWHVDPAVHKNAAIVSGVGACNLDAFADIVTEAN